MTAGCGSGFVLETAHDPDKNNGIRGNHGQRDRDGRMPAKLAVARAKLRLNANDGHALV
jgi:hypothetical protein